MKYKKLNYTLHQRQEDKKELSAQETERRAKINNLDFTKSELKAIHHFAMRELIRLEREKGILLLNDTVFAGVGGNAKRMGDCSPEERQTVIERHAQKIGRMESIIAKTKDLIKDDT
jgi:hypothetical protein